MHVCMRAGTYGDPKKVSKIPHVVLRTESGSSARAVCLSCHHMARLQSCLARSHPPYTPVLIGRGQLFSLSLSRYSPQLGQNRALTPTYPLAKCTTIEWDLQTPEY